MTFIDFLYKLDGWVWGTPLIVLIMVVGIYYMVKGKFFPFVHFGHAVKNTVLASSTEPGKSGDGKISPYRAFCLALGGRRRHGQYLRRGDLHCRRRTGLHLLDVGLGVFRHDDQDG